MSVVSNDGTATRSELSFCFSFVAESLSGYFLFDTRTPGIPRGPFHFSVPHGTGPVGSFPVAQYIDGNRREFRRVAEDACRYGPS